MVTRSGDGGSDIDAPLPGRDAATVPSGAHRFVLAAVIFLAAAVSLLYLPVSDWFELVQGQVRALGPVGPFAVSAAYVVLTVLLVPGSALTIGAGTLFGLWTGFAVVLVGANTGALVSFLLARTTLRHRVERWASTSSRFSRLDRAIASDGFKMVFLTRLSPVFPFTLLNYLLGLTNVTTAAYVLANLAGMLPGIFLYVSIGAAAGQALQGGGSGLDAGKQVLGWVGLAATVAVVALVTRAARRALDSTFDKQPAESPE